MWFAVWSVLVVATLVGAALLGRDLWRKARRLGAELSRASAALDAASARISQAVAEAEAGAPEIRATMFDDPTDLRERVADLRLARAGRAEARRERHRAVAQTWSLDGWLAGRRAARAAQRVRS
jgi:hypothetical protein